MFPLQESDEISSGVSRVIQMMEDYDLTKEDWDSIIEVGQFEGQRDPVASIPSKVCTSRYLIFIGVSCFVRRLPYNAMLNLSMSVQ